MALQIRPARREDVQQLAKLHVDSWRFGHEGVYSSDVLDGVSVEDREKSWEEAFASPSPNRLVLVAEREGTVVGFATSGPARDASPVDTTAEVYELFVDPDAIGTGVGGALLHESRHALKAAGFER